MFGLGQQVAGVAAAGTRVCIMITEHYSSQQNIISLKGF